MEKETETLYNVMDGRAVTDIDRALVLSACRSFSEAMSEVDDFGPHTCIVEVVVEKESRKMVSEEVVYINSKYHIGK